MSAMCKRRQLWRFATRYLISLKTNFCALVAAPTKSILYPALISLTFFLLPQTARSTVISFTSSDLVASIHTLGQYDNAGLGTWNGQPLSPTNKPSDYENQLSADWNLYVLPSKPNSLFIEARNVFDTRYGTIFGAPFTYVGLTGLELELSPKPGKVIPTPQFSNQWARPGQVLDGRPSSTAPVQRVPLTETPGWSFSASGSQFSISTSDIGYALSHFSNIYGTTRITGGAVFELEFPSSVSLPQDVDFTKTIASAQHGFGRYEADGSLTLSFSTIPPFSDVRRFTLGTGTDSFSGSNTIVFDGSNFTIRVDIALTGDPLPADLRILWETAIEGVWGNQVHLIDKGVEYPIQVDVSFVGAIDPADYIVQVRDDQCSSNVGATSVWCTRAPLGASFDPSADMRDEIVAHEFGHMLGLYDEYFDPRHPNVGGRDPAANLTDLCQPLYILGSRVPFVTTGTFCDSMMADFGPVQERYFEQIALWITNRTGRQMVIGNSPLFNTYPLDDPGPGVLAFDGTSAVAEPCTLWILAFGAALLACGCRKRREAPHTQQAMRTPFHIR